MPLNSLAEAGGDESRKSVPFPPNAHGAIGGPRQLPAQIRHPLEERLTGEVGCLRIHRQFSNASPLHNTGISAFLEILTEN